VSAKEARFILGLGGNLGDRAQHVALALEGLSRLAGTEVLGVSEAYETDPVGYADQPQFLNVCAALASTLDPESLLTETMKIEHAAGRVRSGPRDGPRTLDIDLLLWREGAWSSPRLEIPHPRWKSRGFVVFPLRNLLERDFIVKDPRWDSLRAEADRLTTDRAGLRAWQGPTPWIKKTG
jgi:2-amino-4-hydroxy-6-hydroxymethyldihydropteridine diphosphokinase